MTISKVSKTGQYPRDFSICPVNRSGTDRSWQAQRNIFSLPQWLQVSYCFHIHLANEALMKSESFKSWQQLFSYYSFVLSFPSFFSEVYYIRIWTIESLSKQGYYTNMDFILSGTIRKISEQRVVLWQVTSC